MGASKASQPATKDLQPLLTTSDTAAVRPTYLESPISFSSIETTSVSLQTTDLPAKRTTSDNTSASRARLGAQCLAHRSWTLTTPPALLAVVAVAPRVPRALPPTLGGRAPRYSTASTPASRLEARAAATTSRARRRRAARVPSQLPPGAVRPAPATQGLELTRLQLRHPPPASERSKPRPRPSEGLTNSHVRERRKCQRRREVVGETGGLLQFGKAANGVIRGAGDIRIRRTVPGRVYGSRIGRSWLVLRRY